jgi:hypothetical protein
MAFMAPIYGLGQQKLIDSLQKQVTLPNVSTEQRVVDLADLGFMLRSTQSAEAIDYGRKAVEISLSLEDKKYASYAWSKLYYSYRMADSISCVLDAVDSTMWFAKESDDPVALGNAYRVAGNYAYATDDAVKAVDNLLQALELLEGTDNAPVLANIYYMLSGTFVVSEDLDNAGKYARRSAQLDKTGNPDVLCLSGLSMAEYFRYRFEQDGNRSDLDSVMYYGLRTVTVYERSSDVMNEQFTGCTAALNYASYLWSYFPDTPKDTVFSLLNKAIVWATAIKNYAVVANCYGLMSEYLSMEGKNIEAENLLLSAFDILVQERALNSNIYNITAGLLRLAERTGDKDKIIKYQKLYHDYYRKVFDDRQAITTRTLEAKYNHKKKEQEVIALQKQTEHEKNIALFSIGLTVISILALLLLFLYHRLKLRSAKQEKKLLETQARDALLQKQLKEEETRRLELEQELTRQQNEQLQKEVFAGTIQLKQKNEVLETVRKEISASQSNGHVSKIIQDNLQSDDYFDEYKMLIKETHPNFYNSLQTKADGKLTDLDLKYCTYIYMKIPAKQMASLLHVEYNTIRMTKYRMKQKFKLKKEDDLDKFIQDLSLM